MYILIGGGGDDDNNGAGNDAQTRSNFLLGET